VRTLGEVLDMSFSRIQFTPDLMPADILGTNIVMEAPAGAANSSSSAGRSSRTWSWPTKSTAPRPRRSRPCSRRCRSKSVTAGGEIRKLAEPFFVMATQNPIDQEGTYPLPEAQLDRFFFKLIVGYPTAEELTEVLTRTTEGAPQVVSRVLTAEQMLEFQKLVRGSRWPRTSRITPCGWCWRRIPRRRRPRRSPINTCALGAARAAARR
jgi:MoxR-like ATPase